MGMIDEITGLLRKGPELASQFDSIKLNTKSIAHGANDATFQFPVLISNTIPIDMAATIARTMEKTYVGFTQQWLSLNPTIDITLDRNILQYLKKFHRNVTVESAMSELMVKENEVSTYMEKVEDDEYVLFTNKDQTFGVLFNRADRPTAMMLESHKEFLNDFLSDFDLSMIPHVGDTILTEADTVTSGDIASAIINNRLREREDEKHDRDIKNTNMMKSPVLSDREVKKANDMMPYALQVRLMAVNDKKEFVQFIDFVLGVKTILHPVESDDVLENIQRVLQNRSPFFKFLKWTTGEISLFKNIILNLDDVKSDVINKASGKSPWFSKLKRLKDRRLGVKDFTVPYAMIPNTTLVITSYEADYLRNHYAIDVTSAKVARRLIDSMFLMAFIIVDEGTGTVDILYDGSSDYQTYSLETLEREVSLNSNKLGREIGRMISR
jgi:hypothetical protein